jgi:hypothetical protein
LKQKTFPAGLLTRQSAGLGQFLSLPAVFSVVSAPRRFGSVVIYHSRSMV